MASLVHELHDDLRRGLARDSASHFIGLRQAARPARINGVISNKLAMRLEYLDICHNVSRHITEPFCADMKSEVWAVLAPPFGRDGARPAGSLAGEDQQLCGEDSPCGTVSAGAPDKMSHAMCQRGPVVSSGIVGSVEGDLARAVLVDGRGGRSMMAALTDDGGLPSSVCGPACVDWAPLAMQRPPVRGAPACFGRRSVQC